VHLGFAGPQACQIVVGTLSIDWDAATSPMPWGTADTLLGIAGASSAYRFRRTWRGFHAFAVLDTIFAGRAQGPNHDAAIEAARQARVAELRTIGLRNENPGAFPHFHRDREPHGGWADLFGHGPAGHLPGIPDAVHSKFCCTAERIAERTVAALQRFQADMCARHERACCGRPLNDPHRDRTHDVLGRLIVADPVPDFVNFSRDFVTALKELSFDVDPVDDAALASLQHRSILTCTIRLACNAIAHLLEDNAIRAVPRVQTPLFDHGLNMSFATLPKGIHGPADARRTAGSSECSGRSVRHG